MNQSSKVFGALLVLAPIAGSIPVFGQLLAPPAAPATAAAPAAPNANGPRIAFSETRFDFGRVGSSAPVRHEYIVTNTGNAVLEITAVQPGCPSCTTALPWDRQVQPGKTGKIPIQFNPAGFSGTLTKSVTVTCNDPVQPTHILYFQATIWQPVEVQPPYVYFMPVEGEETNETRVVRIVSHLEEPLTLQAPRAENPALKLDLKTVQAGREYALHISHAGRVTNAAPPTAVTIATSSTNVPMVKVTVGVMPQPPLVVSPLQIQVPPTPPAGPSGAGRRHTQMIRNNSSTPLKVTEATVNAEGVTVQINESQPGKLFLLTVTFPASFRIGPGELPVLTVKTSHPKRPVITVPIVQFGAPGSFGRRPAAANPAILK